MPALTGIVMNESPESYQSSPESSSLSNFLSICSARALKRSFPVESPFSLVLWFLFSLLGNTSHIAK